MKNRFGEILDFFFPKYCFHCSVLLKRDENYLCRDCISKIQQLSDHQLTIEYSRKFGDAKLIDQLFSAFVFEKEGPLQSLIHNLKYSTQFRVGIFLGHLLNSEFKKKNVTWDCNIIQPIPLHHMKRASRGFNQSEFIAKGFCKDSNKMVVNLLKRKKYTETQTMLSAKERKHNIKGAFDIKYKRKIPEKIILLDDVITTGSTISEAASVLKNAGCKKIFALSLAIPIGE